MRSALYPRRRALVAAVALCMLAPSSSHGDSPGNPRDKTREKTPFTETAHRARVSFKLGIAVIDVRRKIRNRTATARALQLEIPLPGSAVVTDFRINTGSGWQQGQVQKTDEAAEAYDDLITEGKPARRSMSPALLQVSSRDTLSLDVAAIDARETITLEYTITAPTCYRDDTLAIEFPIEGNSEDGTDDGTELKVRRPTITGRGVRVRSNVDGLPQEYESFTQAACHGSHASIDDADEKVVIEAPAPRGVGLRWTSSKIGDQSLARLELELPTKLAEVPKSTSIVFVLDGSLSMPDSGLTAQLAVAKAIASQLPKATVQFVVYRRKASVLLDRFVRVRDVDAMLAALGTAALEASNGSNLDAGLARAAELLAKRKGHVRIVAFTDSRLRKSLSPEDALPALATLPTDAVVHLVDFHPSGFALDESTAMGHDLETVANSHGGTVLTLSGQTTNPAVVRAKTRHLIAPIRFDTLAIEAGSMFARELDDVPLGVGFRGVAVSRAAPFRIRVRGLLWGAPWMAVATRDETYARIAEQLVAGDGAGAGELDDDDLTELAMRSHVVSLFTSLLAKSRRPVTRVADFGLSSQSFSST